MRKPGITKRVAALATAAILLALAVTPSVAQVRVQGDARVWQEIVAALDRLAKAPTYRMKPMGLDLAEVDNRGSAPAVRWKTKFLGSPAEMVRVGDQVWMRFQVPGTSRATCRKLSPQEVAANPPPLPPRPTDFKGTVRVLKKSSARALAGPPDKRQERAIYEYEYETHAARLQGGGEEPVRHTLHVDRETGLPVRLFFTLQRPVKPDRTLFQGDFFDYGADIRIVVPAGCPRS